MWQVNPTNPLAQSLLLMVFLVGAGGGKKRKCVKQVKRTSHHGRAAVVASRGPFNEN